MSEPVAIDTSLNLQQRIAAARDLLGGGVEKKGKNADQKYDYVKASDVSRVVMDALAQVGVFASPTYVAIDTPLTWVSARGNQQNMAMLKCILRLSRVEDKTGFSMNATAPETIVVETIGFGADTGDKGPYKAMTGALKYALLHSVGLSTDDDPEASVEPALPPTQSAPRRVGPKAASEPEAPTASEATTVVGDDPNAKITTQQSKMLFARATEAGLEPNEFRSLVFAVTSKRKSSDLVSSEVDDILAALADKSRIEQAKGGAKQDAAFDATVGQTPDPTKPAEEEAARIEAEKPTDEKQAEIDALLAKVAELTGGEVVPAAAE